MESRIATLKSVFADAREQEEFLRFRNPSFSYWYNWLVLACVVALFVSFAIWGFDIHTRNAYDAGQRDLYAAMDAEHEEMLAAAAEAERLAAEEDAELQIREAKAIARAIFGIRNFIEKYHYTNEDVLTYARCITNRAEATGKSVEEVLAEEGQFIAYSEHNNLETDYYNLALQFVDDLHAGNLKPCDLKFRYAVLKGEGIWLVDDPGKDVPERWHA